MKKRNVRNRFIIFVVEILMIVILLMVYVGVKNKYENIFYPNTVINGQDCSLLTVEEAKDVIQNKTQKYTLEIIFKDNEVEYISATEIELTINNLEENLTNIKERQRKNLLLRGGDYNFNNFSCDKKKLSEILLTKKQLQLDYMEERTEIKYQFNINSKLFEIAKQNVYYLDFNKVFEEISIAIEQNQKSILLKNLYMLPENHPAILAINELNQLISSQITYQLPTGEEYVLDATTLYTWLVQDESGNYLKNNDIWDNNVEDFVINELSQLAKTAGISREFKPTGKDTTVIVEGGNYGYQVDIESEIAQLKTDLENNLVIERQPCYAKREVSSENSGLGYSYVEIDITRQKVWVYVDGNLKVETDCVTGCVNEGHSTPTGICTLTYKTTDKVLRGRKLANGTYEYASHVDYWMPFNGGIGLHDANWRHGVFGGDIYINDGSHGCINLPSEAAKEIYEIINYEMPIIVYES